MVPDLARMSVIIKSQHETSVMTGNYEMGYACGLLCKLAGREVPQWETPVELKDRVAELLTGYEPANEREKNVIHMLHYYHPDETADEQVKELLDTIQHDMLERARAHREAHTYVAKNYEEFGEIINSKPGFIKAMWCGDRACEDKIKEDFQATSRCMPFEQEQLSDVCVCCGKPAKKMVYWGRAY